MAYAMAASQRRIISRPRKRGAAEGPEGMGVLAPDPHTRGARRITGVVDGVDCGVSDVCGGEWLTGTE